MTYINKPDPILLGKALQQARKKKGLTQQELADTLCVSNKAVSKWERGLALPDINSVPQLAEVLEMSVVELIDSQTREKQDESPMKHTLKETVDLLLRVMPLAMGVAVAVLSAMHQLDANGGLGMLGIGMFCLALRNLPEK